jgi:hypothetical protein
MTCFGGLPRTNAALEDGRLGRAAPLEGPSGTTLAIIAVATQMTAIAPYRPAYLA